MAQMIVVGTDTHKSTHTCGAVEAATARALAEHTAKARRQGFDELLAWARALGPERVWAIEDCRGVSGAFERFLVAHGERIVRIAPKHMAGARKSSRERGKSDSIDACAIARAALKQGIETLPTAHLDERALEIRLLLDHRDNLVAERARPKPAALAPARPVARARDPSGRARPRQVALQDLRPSRPRRAKRAGADRARARASHQGAHAQGGDAQARA
jgi:transposase